MPAYEVKRIAVEQQDSTNLSFAGGLPLMPPSIKLPTCMLCGDQQTFFFQVAFPKDHDWAGKVMAVFAGTTSGDRDYPTPSAHGPDNSIDIPDGHLDNAQTNYRLIVFSALDKLELRQDYTPVLKYTKLQLKPSKRERAKTTRVGGTPYWHIQDDTPRSYMGSRFTFLMQIEYDWMFEKLDSAPRQAEYAWFPSDPNFRTDDLYCLFSGLPLYFFGTLDLPEPKVYLLNQK
jgi:hypothetical protein